MTREERADAIVSDFTKKGRLITFDAAMELTYLADEWKEIELQYFWGKSSSIKP